MFKKTREVERQAELMKKRICQLENANLPGSIGYLSRQSWRLNISVAVLENFCRLPDGFDAQEAAVGLSNNEGETLRYFFLLRHR